MRAPLAHAGIPHENGIVLPPPAEDLHRSLQFVDATDERVELARLRAGRQVHRVRGERVAGRGRSALTLARFRPARVRVVGGGAAGRGDLADAVRDELEHIEASDALVGEELRSERFVLLECRGEHVAGLDLLPARTLDVEDGRLEHPAERERLLGLLLLPTAVLLDRVLQILVEILAQFRQVSAARREDPLPVVVVRERIEQVLQRQMCVSPRGRLPVGDRQDDF
jgi:hypothetical protein